MNSEEKIKKALQLLDELLTRYEKEILYYEDGTVRGNFHMTNLEVVQQITEIKKILISQKNRFPPYTLDLQAYLLGFIHDPSLNFDPTMKSKRLGVLCIYISNNCANRCKTSVMLFSQHFCYITMGLSTIFQTFHNFLTGPLNCTVYNPRFWITSFVYLSFN